MKKYLHCLFLMCLAMVVVFSTSVQASTNSVQSSISAENYLEKKEDKASFTLVLEAADSSEKIEEIPVNGTEKVSFSPQVFSAVGEYAYRVYQKPSTSQDYQADSTVYDVLVYVTYDEKGQLVAKMISRKTGEKEKSGIVFNPRYVAQAQKPQVKKEKPAKQPEPKKQQFFPLPATGEAQSTLLVVAGLALLAGLSAYLIKKIFLSDKDK